jgi:hypothetical protein
MSLYRTGGVGGQSGKVTLLHCQRGRMKGGPSQRGRSRGGGVGRGESEGGGVGGVDAEGAESEGENQ